jgi:cysteine desulfuration protein SufE
VSVPARLQRIVDMFSGAPRELRLQALFDYSKRIPELPEDVDTSSMERVPECQTQFFLQTRLDDGKVRLMFAAPDEAPTVRGYAGILYEGLDGETPETVLAVPRDFYLSMGLSDVVSPLRLRGMDAILFRLQAQVARLTA